MAFFKQGDVISSSRPFVYVTMKDTKKINCDYCLKESPKLKGCSKCLKMFYCDQDCQRSDWNIHKHECKIYKNPFSDLIFTDDFNRTLFRLHLIVEHYPEKAAQKNDVPGSDQKRSLADLAAHKAKALQDPIRVENFQRIVRLFNSIGIQFNKGKLFELYCITEKHSKPIYDFDRLKFIGNSVCIVETGFRHSCSPNAALINDGLNFQVRAMKDIAAGEPITMAYIDVRYNTKARKEVLLREFLFDCDCPRCENPANDDFDYDYLWRMDMQSKIAAATDLELSLFVGQEYLRAVRKILGEYDPYITLCMYRGCRLYTLLNKSNLNEKKMELVNATKKAIQITHGPHHELYRVFAEKYNI